jgi:signal transduction histidine kinase
MLFAIWAGLLAWQAVEHHRVEQAARALLVERARYVAMTCGRIMRAPGRLVLSKELLESSINTLVRPGESSSGELRSVVLVNRDGNIAAAAPTNVDFPRDQVQNGPRWEDAVVWLPNLVDLGTNLGEDLVVLTADERRELINRNSTNRPGGLNTNFPGTGPFSNAPGPGPGFEPFPGAGPGPGPGPGFFPPDVAGTSNRPPPPNFAGGFRRGPPGPRPEFVQPNWMSTSDFKTMSERRGAHNFFVGMSTEYVSEADSADLWIRFIIGLLGTAGVAGYALAYNSLVKTSDLQVRLVRASEMNLHLKEMNLAAAGLAHETRNPLNIIRGLAQIISKQQDASTEIRGKTRDIIDETDRVTAQLNEFINYSRPREVRRAPTDLAAVVSEVGRTLNYDIEEKGIELQIVMEPLMIEADEQLLRQALFNLVLNAVQAVAHKGVIRVRASKRNNEQAFIEISDNGPGVPQANRAEIFKPYFTTHPEGTGLGLSVVQQIVQAHGWEIVCIPNEPVGALFRISHVKLCGKE